VSAVMEAQPTTASAYETDLGRSPAGEAPAGDVPSWRLDRSLRLQIVATLIGGTLLVCSLLAGWLWSQPFSPRSPQLWPS